MSDPRLFETDGPAVPFNPYDGKASVEEMLKLDGMEFGFNIEVKDPRPERTLSAEAFENLRDLMAGWVGTRLVNYSRRRKRGAKKIQVHVLVSLDGEPIQPTEDVPYFSWPDGERRQKAQKK